MSWRLRQKFRKAPAGWEIIADKLDEFEARMREANAEPRGDRPNHQLSWPVHRLHYEKNRYLHDMRYVHGSMSDELFKFLVKEKIADGPLIAKWRKPGYETLCSLAVITKSNTNFGTVGICRTPLKSRAGQIMPNVLTGCVCCASGCNGPIWWDDPVPDIVKERILDADPGKADLLAEQELHDSTAENSEPPERDVDADLSCEKQVGDREAPLREQDSSPPLDSGSSGGSDAGSDENASPDISSAVDKASIQKRREDISESTISVKRART